MRKKVDLTIAIPAFNEARIIKQTVQEVSLWMERNLPAVQFHLQVIDDGSTDETAELFARGELGKVEILSHSKNLGRGAAIRTAFEYCKSEFLIFLDADLSYSPSNIAILLEPLMKGTADVTLASAHHPQGSMKNVPFQRAMVSKFGNLFLRSMLDQRIHTVTCLVRGFNMKAVDGLDIRNNSKEVHLEVLYKAQLLGLRIKEIPTTLEWRDKHRKRSGSFLSNFIPFVMWKSILRHVLFKLFVKPGGFVLGPIYLLVGLMLFGFGSLTLKLIENLYGLKRPLNFENFTFAVRETLISGQLTIYFVAFTFFFLLLLLLFSFQFHQSKRNFEDHFISSSKIRSQLKSIERKLGD